MMIIHRRGVLIGLGALSAWPAGAQTNLLLEVWRDPNCGCCSAWVTHMREAGFTARETVLPALGPVRQMLRTPADLLSCHAARVAGLVLEGMCPRSPYDERLPTARPASSALRYRPCQSARPGWRFLASRTRSTT